MWYLVILIAFGVSTVNGQITCTPKLSSNPYAVTMNTFSLSDFCCIAGLPGVNPGDRIVTLVGTSNAINRFDPATFDPINPPRYSGFNNTGIFAATSGTVGDYCPDGNQPRAIRIGDNEYCLRNGNIEYCNGPLLSPGPFRVRAYVYSNDGTLIGYTTLSPEIFLKNPQDFNLIDTRFKYHSAAMIVITSILPVLFALLLAIITSLMFMNCCCCRVFTPKKCQQDS